LLPIQDPVEVLPQEIVCSIFDMAVFELCLKWPTSRNQLCKDDALVPSFSDEFETSSWALMTTWRSIRLVAKTWYLTLMNAFPEEKLKRLWADRIIISKKGWQLSFTPCSFVHNLVYELKTRPRTSLNNHEITRMYVKAAVSSYEYKARRSVDREYLRLDKYENKVAHWEEEEGYAETKKRKWEGRVEETTKLLRHLEAALEARNLPNFVPSIRSAVPVKPACFSI